MCTSVAFKALPRRTAAGGDMRIVMLVVHFI